MLCFRAGKFFICARRSDASMVIAFRLQDYISEFDKLL